MITNVSNDDADKRRKPTASNNRLITSADVLLSNHFRRVVPFFLVVNLTHYSILPTWEIGPTVVTVNFAILAITEQCDPIMLSLIFINLYWRTYHFIIDKIQSGQLSWCVSFTSLFLEYMYLIQDLH